MPEAAEVEIVRQGLEAAFFQKTPAILNSVEMLDQKLFTKELTGELNWPIHAVRRHGKLLGIDLGEKTIAMHLRLAGRLVLGADPKPRAILHFHSGSIPGQVVFADPRRFATMKLVSTKDFGADQGPDLLHGNLDAWDAEINSRRAIKTVMLDQTYIAGIGNYLIDEALWEREINPEAPSNTLSPGERKEIAYAAREVARKALGAGGMSMRDYVDLDGETGDYQNNLSCYGRSGQPCLRCGKRLSKIKVGGRGTTRCPYCQA